MSDEKAPVTLEGIAAVLATVPALLGHAPQKEQQPALSDALGMLSRACVMAGGKKGPPSGSETESLYREPDYSADDSTEQSRAAVAALGAMLEPFRCAGEHDHTGALSRLIAENKALKEDEAWVEQTVRLISQSEKNVHLAVKAGSNLPEAVGVLLKEREHLSTLLEESGFPSGFRGAYTLFARLQELVVTWREKHQSEVAQRMEDAAETMGDTIRDRLLAILFPGQPAPDLDLDGLLHEADSRLNRSRPPLGNPPPYVVRDAALEEAIVALTAFRCRDSEEVRSIRALKSKPAPQPSENLGELQQAAPKWEPDSPTDLPDEEQPPSEPPPEKLRELFEHREAREEAARRLDSLATSDVHDFGWALAQMHAGKKVRRREWAAQNYEGCWWLVKAEDGTSWWRASTSFGQEPRHLLATDWEVVE